jgi:hypothetical protein
MPQTREASPAQAGSRALVAQGEFSDEVLYEMWTSNVGNPEAAERFRSNGKGVTCHGVRLP